MEITIRKNHGLRKLKKKWPPSLAHPTLDGFVVVSTYIYSLGFQIAFSPASSFFTAQYKQGTTKMKHVENGYLAFLVS